MTFLVIWYQILLVKFMGNFRAPPPALHRHTRAQRVRYINKTRTKGSAEGAACLRGPMTIDL